MLNDQEYREWIIRSAPEKKGHHWHAHVELERTPTEDDDTGQIFHFADIGHFDNMQAAQQRGIDWAKAWIDLNF